MDLETEGRRRGMPNNRSRGRALRLTVALANQRRRSGILQSNRKLRAKHGVVNFVNFNGNDLERKSMIAPLLLPIHRR